MKKQSSYTQILKATSIFGGVQAFKILITIIRSKFVALLLGPAGMGIVGLLSSTLGMVERLTNFGLSTSAVKNIASASGQANSEQRVAEVATALRYWVWVTGLLGMSVTLLTAPWLSELAFGNRDYTLAFQLLSVTLLINQISGGQRVVLQGLRHISALAKAGIYGSVLGLITTIPLYYFYGEQGIIPVIFLTALTGLLLTWYFARKVQLPLVNISRASLFKEGREMLSLGFILSFSGLVTMGVGYLVRIYISNTGSIADVGLYNAGFAMINTYVGMIFTAMSTDYYPRLSSIAHLADKRTELVNQQAEIALLILGPLLIGFILFSKPIIILLYSQQFSPIQGMVAFAAVGILFKAASWAVGFLLLAQGDNKLFFITEVLINTTMLVLNVLGYYFYGLTGLGIAFLCSYILYFLLIFWVGFSRYSFHYGPSFQKIFLIQLILSSVALLVSILIDAPFLLYSIGILLLILTSWYAIGALNQRIEINQLWKKIKNKLSEKK